ncbi:MAG: hypothetical protein ACI81L_003440 [Verrucomicrobiales bacterium]|jgi:hypothetical protein
MELHQVENSSTSNSDGPPRGSLLRRRPWLLTITAALVMVVTAEAVAALAADGEPTAIEKLNEQPRSDVFVFGNSMFQTGIDFPDMREQSGRDIVFDYHNGHYTNLWYLIADQALPEADPPPALVIWGFRPAFAAEPAFRGNTANDNDRFEPGDDIYRSLTVGTGDAVEWWDIAGSLRERVTTSNGLWGQRDAVQAALGSRSTSLGVDIVEVLRPDETEDFRLRFDSGEVTVTDEILRIATGGQVQLAEERVVDGQGDFVRGPIVPFRQSFVPEIIDKIAGAGLDQLVVIWKPVTTVNGGDVEQDETFVADTLEYLESLGINYVDLYHDPGIVLEMFASGDHYNAEGRDYVTEVLAYAISQ